MRIHLQITCMIAACLNLSSAVNLSSALEALVERQDDYINTGAVTIVNNLAFDIHSWSVSDTVDIEHLIHSGESYTESWRVNSNGGGISIKLSTSPTVAEVLQFEYTRGDADTTIYWDMSCIDVGSASQFTEYGFSVLPSQEGAELGCPSVNCGAGDGACSEAYLQPFDDHATHGCPIETSFTVHIGQ